MQIYKIVHGLEKVNWCDENKITNKTRAKYYKPNTLPSQQNGHPLEKFKRQFKIIIYFYFYLIKK